MWFLKPLMLKFQTPATASTFPSKTQVLLQRLYAPTPATIPSSSKLDIYAYGDLVKHCTEHRLPLQAKQLHARIVLSSIIPRSFLASKLIGFYSKINRPHLARHVFDEIPHKNTFCFNSMLIAYAHNNLHADVVNFFLSSVRPPRLWGFEVRPDCYTISCLLKVLSCSFCELGLAKEVHCFALRGGLLQDVVVVNALITCYANCDGVRLARRVFDTMPSRDIVSWNSMIAVYSQGGLYEQCKALYWEMLECSGLMPNEVTVASVLQACGQSNDLNFGLKVHRFIKEAQIEVDLLGYNALIGMYAKCGSLDCARELFMEMSEKDEVTYGALISGYMFHGFVDRAIDLYRQIKTPRLSTWNAVVSGLFQNNHYVLILDFVREMEAFGFRPNAVTLTSILPTFAYFSNLKGGKEVHAYAIRNGCDDHSIYVATAIIDTYGKTGYLHGAQHVFEQSKYRSPIIWTAIIAAFAAHGDATGALSHFEDMLENGIRPDSVTFTAVLTACAHSGMVDEARNIFDAMLAEYGIKPSVEHYACIVGVLSRAGRLSEAMSFIHRMSIEPSAKVWGALLNGASVSRDCELGKLICDRLFDIEPENTGNYVIMANLYSQAGRWKEAHMVREKMRKIGLQKIPGSSWIETSQGLKSFVAKDASNECTEEIYKLLEGLFGLMKEEGYSLQDDFDKSVYA